MNLWEKPRKFRDPDVPIIYSEIDRQFRLIFFHLLTREISHIPSAWLAVRSKTAISNGKLLLSSNVQVVLYLREVVASHRIQNGPTDFNQLQIYLLSLFETEISL